MAPRSKASSASEKKTENDLSAAARAKVAHSDGDFRAARALALSALAQGGLADDARADLERIITATRVDRAPIVAGLVMFAVLIFLFAFVLTQHAH